MNVAMISSLPEYLGGSETGGISIHTAQLSKNLADIGTKVSVLAQNITDTNIGFYKKYDNYSIYSSVPNRSIACARYILGSLNHFTGTFPKNFNSMSIREKIALISLASRYLIFLDKIKPDIVCFQEVQCYAYNFLYSLLEKDYPYSCYNPELGLLTISKMYSEIEKSVLFPKNTFTT